ncbi:hypothetical protein [Streptomyces sp. NPDC045470]|uniref:hypothetical protein n=1 Tax=Streptomyces sp. NPDC045470 TaxID=3155469 RepID=UPI00341167CC
MDRDLDNTVVAELLPMWYALPEGFHPVDLAQEPGTRMDAHYDALARIYPAATSKQLITSVLSFEATLSKLVEEGLVHFSSFTLRTDDGLLLTGTCNIVVADRPMGDPNLYPRAVLDAQPDGGGRGEHRGIVELPAGLAAVVVSDTVIPVPGVFFGVPENGATEVLSVSFHMAFPRLPKAVVVTLSTEEFQAQEEFLELATVVAGGISFTAPQLKQGRGPLADEETAAATSPFG